MPNVQVNQRPKTLSLPADVMSVSGYDRIMRNGDVVQQGRGMGGLGMTAQEIAALIQAGSQATLPLIVAQNPGTRLETGANGQMVIYHQPTGTTANLMGGFTGVPQMYPGSGAGGNIQTPIGSATFGGLKTENLVMIALAAVAVIALMKGK